MRVAGDLELVPHRPELLFPLPDDGLVLGFVSVDQREEGTKLPTTTLPGERSANAHLC